MAEYKIPQPTEPLTLPDGSISKQWYNYWRTRVEGASLEEVLALIAEIQAQLAEIGQLDPKLTGLDSVQVVGQILTGAQVSLVNDEANPFPVSFYSTDESGAKGWSLLYPNLVPNPYADYIVDEDGNYIVDENGNFIATNDPKFDALGSASAALAAAIAYAVAVTGDTMTGALLMGEEVSPSDNNVPIRIAGDENDVLVPGLAINRFNNAATTGPVIMGKARGTKSVPLAVNAGDALFDFRGRGHYGAAWGGISCRIRMFANEAFTSTAQGTRGAFEFTPDGSTTAVPVATMWGNGNVALNPAAVNSGTLFGGGVKVLGIANATTVPASNPTGGGVIYVESGALKYRGSSGTVTTLGPA